MTNSILLEFLGDTPFTRVLDFLIENSIFDYTKKDIAENAEISRTSLYKIWNKILKFDIVVKSRKIGNTTLYQLNKKTESVKQLIELDRKLSKAYADNLDETPKPA